MIWKITPVMCLTLWLHYGFSHFVFHQANNEKHSCWMIMNANNVLYLDRGQKQPNQRTRIALFFALSLLFDTQTYPRSLNISLHLIIGDFARRRQLLKSKCVLAKCRKLPGAVFYFFEVVLTLYMFVFREFDLSH